ncbi:hypothetical protein LCGC14_1374730 [marine sediment metagenome]|uniref:Thioredoxin domain-containing protein n=1 Tax=marine sediment metagenome TaxID=412755 RepID=A0A0F9K4E4_9ZZZZ
MDYDTIAITGMGVVSSIGTTLEVFTRSLKKNRSGLTSLNRFDPSPFHATRSFEISDFKLEGKNARALMRINKNAQYTIAAAREALHRADYPLEVNPYEVGLVLGSSFLDVALVTKYMTDVLKSRLKDYRPLQFPNTVPNATAAHTAIELKIRGPNISLISMQNGAFCAVEYAIRMLRTDQVKMVLVGGVDVFSRERFLYFQQLERIAGSKGSEIHIPFAQERNGFILGEGCGILALEKTEDARKRGALIMAEIRSLVSTYFPCPITEPLVADLPNTRLLYDRLLETANLEKGNIVVDFYADWCKPCNQLSSIIAQVSREFTHITFIKVNIDTFSNIRSHYNIKSIPTLIYFKNGSKIFRSTGLMSKNQLANKLKVLYS